MKIVCENCSTKYSIADEKVRGKVFKIRCKKCGHIIVVKGTAMASEESPEAAAGQFEDKETRVFDYSGFAESMSSQAVWHLVIDGGQVGPLTGEQVAAKFDAGEIDGETYTWKEGFKDWLRLADVEDFASLAAEEDGRTELMNEGQAASMLGGASPAPAAAKPAPTATPAPSATPAPAAKSSPAAAASSGGGLFGSAPAESAAPSGGLFGDVASRSTPAPQAAAPAGGGLFGGPSASPAAGGGLFGATGAASPASSRGALFPDEPEAASDGPKMTGQRNENSVLFSLSNLQSLATGGGSAKTAASATSKPGYASAKSEGSGLVDIRAMAATAIPKDSAMSEGFSFSAPALSTPMSAAPVLMPVADSGRAKWILPAVIVGGLLLVAVIVLLVVVLMKDDKRAPQDKVASDSGMDVAKADPDMAADMAADPAADMAADMAADVAADMAADMAADPAADMAADPAADMAADPAADMAATDPGRRRPTVYSGMRTSGGGGGGGGSTRPRPEPMPTAMHSTTPAAMDSSLQALLQQAAGPMGGGGGGGGGENLPARLGPGDIRSGVDGVIGSARACYNRYRVAGTCNVRVVISGSSGRPSGVSVQGSFAGTPTGRCVEQAFQRAKFKRFSSASQSFVFPLIFR